ncbi:N-acetylglutamate synthase [compost metagenome]
MHIRPTVLGDVAVLPEVERSAAQAFAWLPGLAWLAEGDVLDGAVHRGFIEAGGSWVAVDDSGRILGFACVDLQPRALHLHELSVRREAQGQGIGRMLLDQVVGAALELGVRELTLTTFSQVPWNAPFYARYGFEVVEGVRLDARLREILAEEERLGFSGRCAMSLSM